MRIEIGACMICDKDMNPGDRTDVEVEWSNRSKMRIGVCRDCATTHRYATPEGKKNITEWHWGWWEKTGGKFDREIVIV